MKVLSSSLRERTIDSTLAYALQKAIDLNITRVTDTTLLDKIGIPVFASIRPRGNALCVNAGKGFTMNEAKIGALMEAIEYAYVEYGYSNTPLTIITVAELIEQLPANVTIEDFAIQFGKTANTDELIACVTCEHFFNKKPFLLPAQLVFIPFPNNPGVSLFGTTTNGLASGNSIEEATVHAICELLERDVTSFNLVKDTTCLVDVNHSSERISKMKEQIVGAGLDFALRYSDNPFGMPYFEAYIIDQFTSECTTISGGYGLHPIKEIAAVRAIAEAAQSRLTTIHGGRDDIIDDVDTYNQLGDERKLQLYLKKKSEILNPDRSINYTAITEPPAPLTIDEAMQLLIASLKRNNMEDIFTYVFTQQEDELQVIKVIIPKLERLDNILKRIGPRLLNYVLNNKS